MFTGLIEDVGLVSEIKSRNNYCLLTIESKTITEELRLGDSVSCDGACLTVTGIFSNKFSVEASQETEARTILKSYNKGSKINLERALKVGSRLGGHFVSGHIDCIGVVDTLTMVGDSLKIKINYNKSYDKYVIEKGSVALNGISLTVNEISSGSLSVNLIPHSVDNTTVDSWKKGDKINLEFDMIGKYVLNINQNKNNNTLTKDKLFECGW